MEKGLGRRIILCLSIALAMIFFISCEVQIEEATGGENIATATEEYSEAVELIGNAVLSQEGMQILEEYGSIIETDTQYVYTPTRGEDREASIQGPYKVVRVVDGDTLVLDMDGTEEKVRLIGVDTPESVHPDENRNVEYGKIASDYSKGMLTDKEVCLEYDAQQRDRYGRILAYIYLDNIMYNEILLAEGHAKVATYPPNVKYVDYFTAIQEAARENEMGVWAIESEEITEETTKTPVLQTEGIDYIGNKNSRVFHYSDCSSVSKMSEGNKVGFESRDEAVSAGYKPCGNCNP